MVMGDGVLRSNYRWGAPGEGVSISLTWVVLSTFTNFTSIQEGGKEASSLFELSVS